MYEPRDIQKLVRDALNGFEEVHLATSARKAFRIARLMGHGDEAWLFMHDLRPIGGSQALRVAEMSAFFVGKEYEEVRSASKSLREVWIEERSPHIPEPLITQFGMAKDALVVGSIPELENHQNRFESDAANEDVAMKAILQMRADLNREILDRIRTRTFTYLCRVETDLAISAATEQIFESRRQRVDSLLGQIDPEVLEKFNAAYRRVLEGESEARSQAIGSCRRILKSLADLLFPATDTPVVSADGKSHPLTDDMYLNRLTEFLNNSSAGGKFSESLQATLQDVVARLKALNGLSSKGLHEAVSVQEVEWCVIQMYLVAGELLQLQANGSE